MISSSENSPGEENPSDDQFGQIKDLPENLEACCVSDSDPEVNSPNACPNTIRKTVYITEDCVYCGKIRTVSQVIPWIWFPKIFKDFKDCNKYLFFFTVLCLFKKRYKKRIYFFLQFFNHFFLFGILLHVFNLETYIRNVVCCQNRCALPHVQLSFPFVSISNQRASL